MSESHALLDRLTYINSKIDEEIENAVSNCNEKLLKLDPLVDELENWFDYSNLPVIGFMKRFIYDENQNHSESEVIESFNQFNELDKASVLKMFEVSFKMADLESDDSDSSDDENIKINRNWYNIFKNLI